MIEFRNLTKTYAANKYRAVDDLSFTVENGEIFGFLGPNGAGKSTTLKCMTGILKYEEGQILIDGIDLKTHPIEAKKKMGFVPDEHLVYEGLKGMQYINLIADIFGVSPEDRKARMEKYLPLFGMEEKIHDNCSSYSHGMKQKLSILSVLCHEPDVFILDEPMTGLDPQSSHALKTIMSEYAQKGKTVFFSSHVLEVVEKICTKVAIIDHGKLMAVCDMKELKEKQSDGSLETYFLNVTSGEDTTL